MGFGATALDRSRRSRPRRDGSLGLGRCARLIGPPVRRGEIWWADLGPHRPQEQTGRRPVVIWQSDALTSIMESVLVVPLTTNLDRAHLAGNAVIEPLDGVPRITSVALAFQMR